MTTKEDTSVDEALDIDFESVPPCEATGHKEGEVEWLAVFRCCAYRIILCDPCLVEIDEWIASMIHGATCDMCNASHDASKLSDIAFLHKI